MTALEHPPVEEPLTRVIRLRKGTRMALRHAMPRSWSLIPTGLAMHPCGIGRTQDLGMRLSGP